MVQKTCEKILQIPTDNNKKRAQFLQSQEEDQKKKTGPLFAVCLGCVKTRSPDNKKGAFSSNVKKRIKREENLFAGLSSVLNPKGLTTKRAPFLQKSRRGSNTEKKMGDF